jgi:hypothetical protein
VLEELGGQHGHIVDAPEELVPSDLVLVEVVAERGVGGLSPGLEVGGVDVSSLLGSAASLYS